MKTTFTKFFVVTFLLTSQFVFSQVPLLPLFENNTIKWGAYSYSRGSICSANDPIPLNLFYEIIGDTIIDSKEYKILLTNSKSCFDCGQFPNVTKICSKGIIKKYIKQDGNLIVEVGRDGILIDTILYIESTSVGSKVRFGKSRVDFHVKSIDSILFNSTKVRRFNFENFYGYLDGIGFDNNGPYLASLTYQIGDGSAYLTCFEKNGLSYSMARINSGKISGVNLATSACENPLAIDAENIEQADLLKIFVNLNNQLETSEMASSIEIIDSKGQKMIQNKDAYKTDVSVLLNGIYIANITFANKVLKHKFLFNN